ncbi:MAG: lysophospholipid acyltransferase family protein [Dysgonomonas sp.]
MKKIIFFIYQLFIFAPIFILATIITAIVVMVGCIVGDRKFWSCYPPRYWSKLACRLALCKINVIRKGKLEPNQSYIFVANHQGAYDIFLIYGYLGQDIKWVQKKELRKIPFVGKASEIAGHVFVDQSSRKSMIETIKKAEEQLSEGASIAIFPEGARTYTGKMDRFKRGAFIIAKEMKLPVVPVTVNGPFDVMKIHTYLINPGKLELIIHDPIPTKDLTDDDIPELMNKCHEIVHSGLWEKYK